MRDDQNIQEVAKLSPTMMGFIFYKHSPRFFDVSKVVRLPEGPIRRVGVFVNADLKEISEKQAKYDLDLIQLHGEEPVELLKEIRDSLPVKVIKVFRISENLPFGEMGAYVRWVEFFLFDTQTNTYGGSGRKFDWKVLDDYPFDVPFILSGGIDLDDIPSIQKLDHPALAGIDVNSRFESSPGYKDIEKLKKLKLIWER